MPGLVLPARAAGSAGMAAETWTLERFRAHAAEGLTQRGLGPARRPRSGEGWPGAGPCSPGPRGRPFQKPPQTALCSAATARSAAPTRTRRCKGSGWTSWAWPRGPQHVRISESPGGLNNPPAQGSGCELRAGGGGRLRRRHRGRRWAEWAVPGSGHRRGPSGAVAKGSACPRCPTSGPGRVCKDPWVTDVCRQGRSPLGESAGAHEG